MSEPVPIIDLFAGPGGLGEGFSALRTKSGERVFRIAISAEMDPTAHATLRLRAFYRQFPGPDEVPQKYYDYLAGKIDLTELENDPSLRTEWQRADEEARCLTLGEPEDDRELYQHLRKLLKGHKHWVLIGGPPCQAYSLVGRARNQGITGYRAENDQRHFLYREYLEIVREFRPSVFVMENVKGILSSSVSGESVFRKILKDLSAPIDVKTRGRKKGTTTYRLFSLKTGLQTEPDDPDSRFDPRDFVVRSEDYGIPQRRHRVFVLGVRDDIDVINPPRLSPIGSKAPTIAQVIEDLEPLRSGISRNRNPDAAEDSYENWKCLVESAGAELASDLKLRETDELFGGDYGRVVEEVEGGLRRLRASNRQLEREGRAESASSYSSDAFSEIPTNLASWFRDVRLSEMPNHETRTHIPSDLQRYLFCAAWGAATGSSPKSSDFLPMIVPDHQNWTTGKFADRFRVQVRGLPATTITSHISKDGHYFIHYDPAQCRSLTVREAARIQTFPDNYFFEGPRTSQYIQVGNAVPPFLAIQIAAVVQNMLEGITA